jgi:IS5 family transposase
MAAPASRAGGAWGSSVKTPKNPSRELIPLHSRSRTSDRDRYEIHAARPADVTLWTPALDRHQAIFGRAPDLAAGDRGFSSATNEQAATARGIRRVILPRRGPKSPTWRAYERQHGFRRGQRWRVGCEGRISVLKRRHGLDRCRYHGEDGMHRWVGLGVIANNLVSTATFSKARATA